MKITALTALAFASVLSLGAFGCASNSADDTANAAQEVHTAAKTINASTEERFGALGGVWKVTGIDNDAGMDLSIVEMGGGDPALNGNYPVLTAYGPDHGDGGVFELGMNVSQITKLSMAAPDTIKIEGTYDTIDPKTDDVKSGVPFEALVKLTLVDRDIQPTITVTRDGSAEKIEKTTDATREFLYSLYEVHQQESKGGNIVRLFETGRGGDPAMNGGQLVLNIMSYPEDKTYDLGLNINTVQKFEVTDSTVIIEGSEDIMGSNGDIQQRPFAYTINYSIGTDGSPASSIKLQRTR